MPAPTPSPPTTTTPHQATQLKQSDLQQDGLPLLNAILSQMQTAINSGAGAAGMVKLPTGVDVAGSTVTGLAAPTSPLDAVSSAHAEANYSAAALAPRLEAGGPHSLKTFRALNSKAQTESYSNFLEPILSTAPTTNTSQISATGVSGGAATVTVSAGSHLFPSGNTVPYSQRSDTLIVPGSGQAIYYYFREGASQTLALAGPVAQDSQQSRLGVNTDGRVLVAVATLDSGGLVLNQSAAGATSPTVTGNFRLLTRL